AWTDSRLTWTPSSYGTITDTFLFEDDVWSPVLVVVDSTFGYTAQELVIASGGIDLTYYSSNGEWTLKDTWTETETGTYSTVKYWFKFKRKPDYYGLNLILPVIMLSVLSVLIFVLPAESGEMMGFSVTLLLTFIVFVQVLASMIPTTSESTSFF
ncbi:hypothetical protein BaRGS_00000934, partial [Batillaria attramentaria]